GIAGVAATAVSSVLAADDQEKEAREALRAAEDKLRAAEAEVKLARANLERAKIAQLAQKEALLRQQLQSLEWGVEGAGVAGGGVFTLRLRHSHRLFLAGLPVARDARVSIDNVPGKVAGLKVGMRLGLRLAADDLVVTRIDALTPEKVYDYLVKEV